MTEPGDSGSWIVDADSGDIYGILVACSTIMEEGYVLPAKEVFDSIRRNTNKNSLVLPTLKDSLKIALQYENHEVVKSLISKQDDDNQPTMAFVFTLLLFRLHY